MEPWLLLRAPFYSDPDWDALAERHWPSRVSKNQEQYSSLHKEVRAREQSSLLEQIQSNPIQSTPLHSNEELGTRDYGCGENLPGRLPWLTKKHFQVAQRGTY